MAHGDKRKSNARYDSNYVEDYWPCVGVLLAINSIGS